LAERQNTNMLHNLIYVTQNCDTSHHPIAWSRNLERRKRLCRWS